MRKIHHLLAALSILIMGGSTLTMIHGTTMTEVTMSLFGMITGGIVFLIYTRINNEINGL